MDLAEKSGEGPVDLHSIAGRQAIPEKYLSKLALQLVAGGFLRSSRGSRGGYELARRPEDIDILSVVEVLEGPLSLVDCTSGAEPCPRFPACGAKSLWSGLETIMRGYLSERTLADVAAVQGEPEYYI
jgi:Rrf2 family protein